jgi:hypothetical protein
LAMAAASAAAAAAAWAVVSGSHSGTEGGSICVTYKQWREHTHTPGRILRITPQVNTDLGDGEELARGVLALDGVEAAARERRHRLAHMPAPAFWGLCLDVNVGVSGPIDRDANGERPCVTGTGTGSETGTGARTSGWHRPAGPPRCSHCRPPAPPAVGSIRWLMGKRIVCQYIRAAITIHIHTRSTHTHPGAAAGDAGAEGEEHGRGRHLLL